MLRSFYKAVKNNDIKDQLDSMVFNINRIKELSKSIELATILDSEQNSYNVQQGSCEAIGLWKGEYSAVQRAVLSPNTLFPIHKHDGAKEVLIVVQGEITNDTEGVVSYHSVGGIIEIPADKAHSVYTKDGCTLIATTVPASEGYPNGRNE
jgi:quercetin dioxygenase-like cupin family protein